MATTHSDHQPSPPLGIQTANAETIAQAAAILRAGGLVAFPTETVYGLGADALSEAAVAAIFKAKGRPAYNPLICHVPDIRSAEELGLFDDRARQVAEAFWPGALTLVVKRNPRSSAAEAVSAGLDTIAIRMPDHELALNLLRETGRPLAAPSANTSGAVSPTTAAHVQRSLGEAVDMILDGGPCRVGVESTVLALTSATPLLLRPGGVTLGSLEASIGPVALHTGESVTKPQEQGLMSPGLLDSHYAPQLPVRLNAGTVGPGEAALAFGTATPDNAGIVLNLSAAGDLDEAAANLFRFLHELDNDQHTGIAVVPIPERGIGRAINDRLRRAAAPR